MGISTSGINKLLEDPAVQEAIKKVSPTADDPIAGEATTGVPTTTDSDTTEPAIGADPAVLDRIKEQAGVVPGVDPTLPAGTKITAKKLTESPDEIIADQTQLEDIDVTASKAPTDELEVTAPTKPTYKGVTTATTQPGVTAIGPAEAAYGELSPEAVIGEIKGEVSAESIATAATADLDEKATMTYQLGELYKSLEAGKPLPAWAAPAARAANAVMLQRGLGSSSMAAAASVQALMESATPIAAADAQKYATIQLQNLNNEQQTALQNAATYAAMDRANLDVRLQAAVTNARSFLSIDTQNLTNEQASNTLTYNAKLQSVFTDAAAENATAQFNAKSQVQVDQFFAELGSQVEAANKNRVAAQEQFNVDQANAMSQFVEQANNQRQQFNINMQAQIDQSNALWRREINTVNTAVDNEVNRINAQNLLGLTTSAQNALWQKYRDEATWVFQMAENEAQRIHQFGIAAMEADANADMYDQETQNKFAQMLGGQALKSIFEYFTD